MMAAVGTPAGQNKSSTGLAQGGCGMEFGGVGPGGGQNQHCWHTPYPAPFPDPICNLDLHQLISLTPVQADP